MKCGDQHGDTIRRFGLKAETKRTGGSSGHFNQQAQQAQQAPQAFIFQ